MTILGKIMEITGENGTKGYSCPLCGFPLNIFFNNTGREEKGMPVIPVRVNCSSCFWSESWGNFHKN